MNSRVTVLFGPHDLGARPHPQVGRQLHRQEAGEPECPRVRGVSRPGRGRFDLPALAPALAHIGFQASLSPDRSKQSDAAVRHAEQASRASASTTPAVAAPVPGWAASCSSACLWTTARRARSPSLSGAARRWQRRSSSRTLVALYIYFLISLDQLFCGDSFFSFLVPTTKLKCNF